MCLNSENSSSFTKIASCRVCQMNEGVDSIQQDANIRDVIFPTFIWLPVFVCYKDTPTPHVICANLQQKKNKLKYRYCGGERYKSCARFSLAFLFFFISWITSLKHPSHSAKCTTQAWDSPFSKSNCCHIGRKSCWERDNFQMKIFFPAHFVTLFAEIWLGGEGILSWRECIHQTTFKYITPNISSIWQWHYMEQEQKLHCSMCQMLLLFEILSTEIIRWAVKLPVTQFKLPGSWLNLSGSWLNLSGSWHCYLRFQLSTIHSISNRWCHTCSAQVTQGIGRHTPVQLLIFNNSHNGFLTTRAFICGSSSIWNQNPANVLWERPLLYRLYQTLSTLPTTYLNSYHLEGELAP